MKHENPQPGSDERDELARLLPAPPERDLPSGRRLRLQEFVVNHIQDQSTTAPPRHRLPRRRFAIATGALAAVAAAAVVLTVATGGGDADPDARTEAVRTFEMAASYAAAQPWTEPRPDQWFYIKIRDIRSGAMADSKGNAGAQIDEAWYRADGEDTMLYDEAGDLQHALNSGTEYPWLVTLPTEPTALLAALRQQIIDQNNDPDSTSFYSIPETEEGWNSLLFSRISYILGDNMLPPALTAALYRAAGLIPGVTVAEESVAIDGRETTAVTMVGEDWYLQQMLLDPETHEYVGYRETALTDYTYPTDSPSGSAEPGYGAGEPVTELEGEILWERVRLVAVIVDEPGDTT